MSVDKEEEKEAEEVKALIKDVERDTAKYLIEILQAIVNEQVQSRDLHKETGNYIIDAVIDQVRRKGWIE